MRKNGEQTKQEEKVDCLQGANPVLPRVAGPLGGTLAIFFYRIFGVVPDFQETKRL